MTRWSLTMLLCTATLVADAFQYSNNKNNNKAGGPYAYSYLSYSQDPTEQNEDNTMKSYVDAVLKSNSVPTNAHTENARDVRDFAQELRSHQAVERHLQQELHAAMDAYAQSLQQPQVGSKKDDGVIMQGFQQPAEEKTASEVDALTSNEKAFNEIVEQSRNEFKEWLGQQVPITSSDVDTAKQRSARLLELEKKLDSLESKKQRVHAKDASPVAVPLTNGKTEPTALETSSQRQARLLELEKKLESLEAKQLGSSLTKQMNELKGFDAEATKGSDLFGKKDNNPSQNYNLAPNTMKMYGGTGMGGWGGNRGGDPRDPPASEVSENNSYKNDAWRLQDEIDQAMQPYIQQRQENVPPVLPENDIDAAMKKYIGLSDKVDDEELSLEEATIVEELTSELEIEEVDVPTDEAQATSTMPLGDVATENEMSSGEILNGVLDTAEEATISSTNSTLDSPSSLALEVETIIEDAEVALKGSDEAVAEESASSFAVQEYQEIEENIDNVTPTDKDESDSPVALAEDEIAGGEVDQVAESLEMAQSSEIKTSQQTDGPNEPPVYFNVHASVKLDLSNVVSLGQGELFPEQPPHGQGVGANDMSAVSISTHQPSEAEVTSLSEEVESPSAELEDIEEPTTEESETSDLQGEPNPLTTVQEAKKDKLEEKNALGTAEDVVEPTIESIKAQTIQNEVVVAVSTATQQEEAAVKEEREAKLQTAELREAKEPAAEEAKSYQKSEEDALQEEVNAALEAFSEAMDAVEAMPKSNTSDLDQSSATATSKQSEQDALQDEVNAALAEFNEAMDAMEDSPNSKLDAKDLFKGKKNLAEDLLKSVQTAQEFLREQATTHAGSLEKGEDLLKSALDGTKRFLGSRWPLSADKEVKDRPSVAPELPYFLDMNEPSVVVFNLEQTSESHGLFNLAQGKAPVAISKDPTVAKSVVQRKPELSQRLFKSIADVNGGRFVDKVTPLRDTKLTGGPGELPISTTQRILTGLPQKEQSTAWSTFQKLDNNWAQLKGTKHGKTWLQRVQNDLPPPYPFVTDDESMGNTQCWSKLREQEDKDLDYDVIVAGGTLGIFFAMELLLKGEKVCVIEGGDIRLSDQGWDLSMQELVELKELGILSAEDLDATISPAALVQRVADRFTALGGVLMQGTPIMGVTVSEFNGAAVDLGSEKEPITASLIIDCLGNVSPMTRQSRYGQQPDGICFMVGSCADGFSSQANRNGGKAFSVAQTNENKATQQYFWEVPVSGGTSKMDGTTTYMCTFMDADNKHPSLECMLEEYWRQLMLHGSISDPEVDLDIKRILCAYYPAYRNLPLKQQWSRILAVGDSSGILSPLNFGGAGAFTKNLDRISTAIGEAVESRCLENDNLCKINVSAKIGHQGVDPELVSRLFASAFKSEGVDSSVIKPLLRDLILKEPSILPKLIQQVGLPTLTEWLFQGKKMNVFGLLDNLVGDEIGTVVNKMEDPGIKVTWLKQLEFWKNGGGNGKGHSKSKVSEEGRK